MNEHAQQLRAIAGALRSAIDAHGPINRDGVASAAKRIRGQLAAIGALKEGLDTVHTPYKMIGSAPDDADYLVRGFAPTNQGGHLLVETWHRGEASKDLEVSVWQARRGRGEVGVIEVVDRKRYRTYTV